MIDKGAPALREITKWEKISTTEDVTGFSLMELLVVIVIIGVIAAIGTPQFLAMRTKSSVRADTRDLHSAYRQTQSEAVNRGFIACLNVRASDYQILIADYFRTGETTYNGDLADYIEEGWSTMLPLKEIRAGNTVTPEFACFNSRGLPLSGVGTIQVSNQLLTMEVTMSPSGHVKSTVQ